MRESEVFPAVGGATTAARGETQARKTTAKAVRRQKRAVAKCSTLGPPQKRMKRVAGDKSSRVYHAF
jgi:hypothetical protein